MWAGGPGVGSGLGVPEKDGEFGEPRAAAGAEGGSWNSSASSRLRASLCHPSPLPCPVPAALPGVQWRLTSRSLGPWLWLCPGRHAVPPGPGAGLTAVRPHRPGALSLPPLRAPRWGSLGRRRPGVSAWAAVSCEGLPRAAAMQHLLRPSVGALHAAARPLAKRFLLWAGTQTTGAHGGSFRRCGRFLRCGDSLTYPFVCLRRASGLLLELASLKNTDLNILEHEPVFT